MTGPSPGRPARFDPFQVQAELEHRYELARRHLGGFATPRVLAAIRRDTIEEFAAKHQVSFEAIRKTIPR